MNAKKLLGILFFFIGLSISAHSQANLNFVETDHDFGVITEGKDTLWYDFEFKNTGSEPLYISDVKTSCDCTLAKWPKDPVQPGKTAVIKGGFKIEGKSGRFEKSIIIFGNTSPATTILNIKGTIVPKGTEG